MPNAPKDETPLQSPLPTATPESSAAPAPTATPEPTMVPAMATAHDNATRTAPVIEDPAVWDDNAEQVLSALEKQFASYGITLTAKEEDRPAGRQQRGRDRHRLHRGRRHRPLRRTLYGHGLQRRRGHPDRLFFHPRGLQLAAATGPATASMRPASTAATCSTAYPTTASTRTMWSMTSSTSWYTIASLGCIRAAVVAAFRRAPPRWR